MGSWDNLIPKGVPEMRRHFSIVIAVLSMFVTAACSQGEGERGVSVKIRMAKTMNGNASKKEALAKLEEIYRTAQYHEMAVERIADLISAAKHNYDSLVYAAELMAGCGFHTQVLQDVADAASKAMMEIPEYRDIVELAVIKLGGSDEVVKLAQWASRLTDSGQMEELRTRITDMKAGAEAQSVEEAKRMVDEMLKSWNQSVKGQ
jgi:hypothetical protein